MRREPTRTRLFLLGIAIVSLAGCDLFTTPEARLERARDHVERANYRGALVELKNALQKNPELHPARLLLAEVALWLGDATSADTELNRVPATENPAAIADLQTRIDLALGRYKEALERVDRSGDLLDHMARPFYRGQALQGLRDPAGAEVAFREALEIDRRSVAAKSALAASVLAQGDHARAGELSSQLIDEHPESAEAWFVHGSILLRSEADAAQQAIERAQSMSAQLDVPKQIAVLSTLTDLRLSRGALDDARRSSEMLTRLAPGAPIASLMSSRVAMASNDYAGAAAELRRLVNAAPQFVQARFMLGAALSAQGNLEQASHELARVVREAPHLVEARQLLARVRMRLDDPDGALQVLVPALQADHGASSDVMGLFDAVRTQAGSSPRTIELLEQQLAKSPDNPTLVTQLASAYLQTSQPERALALLEASQHEARVDPRQQALWLQATLDARGTSRARHQASRLIAAHPDDPQIVGMVAAFYGRLGEIGTARDTLTSALQRSPDSPELHIALARLEWEARRPEDARKVLQALLSNQQGHAGARLALAELELAAGQSAAAQRHLEYLRDHDEQPIAPLLMLAKIALGNDEAARADKLIAEALSIDKGPNQAGLRAAAGNLYLEHGRYDQAIAHFRAAVAAEPDAAPAWLNLGRAQLALNQHGAARDSFAQALSARPNWLAAEGALVFLHLQAGEQSSALERIAALKKKRPQDAEVLVLEGQVFATLRQYRDAAASFDQAANLRMTGQTALYAYQARQLGQLPNPAAPLERWVQQHPEDLTFRSLLADAYLQGAERSKAIEQYEFILARQTAHPASLNNLAWLYYETKNPRSVEVARRAYAAAPNSAAIADTLGWILVETGRIGEGLPILERAVAALKSEPEIRYHYAIALIRAGDEGQGRRHLEGLLRDHPTFPSRSAAEEALARLANSAKAAAP